MSNKPQRFKAIGEMVERSKVGGGDWVKAEEFEALQESLDKSRKHAGRLNDEAERVVQKYGHARHVALELSGVMREYIDLPYNGLRQQLLKTLDRYQARLEDLRKDHFEDLAKPIALPDRKDVTKASYTACLQNDGWNSCLDEIAKNNAIQPKAAPVVVQMREAMECRAARQQIAELHIGEAWLTVTYGGLKWYHWNMAGMDPTPLSIEDFDEILTKELAPC